MVRLHWPRRGDNHRSGNRSSMDGTKVGVRWNRGELQKNAEVRSQNAEEGRAKLVIVRLSMSFSTF